MKNINAFIKISNIRGIVNQFLFIGFFTSTMIGLKFINPIKDTTYKFWVDNLMNISVVWAIGIFCFLSLRNMESFNYIKEYFKNNKMSEFFSAYNDVVSFNKTIKINLIFFGLYFLFYALFLIDFISVFFSNPLYIEVTLLTQVVGISLIASSLVLYFLLYKKIWTESISTKKEFNETLNEKNISIGLHKGKELVSAHSISEFLGYIKDGYSCDEEYVKKTLFN